MSENSFPFDAPAETAPFEDDASATRSRTPMLMAAGAIASLVLGAGAFLLLTGGGEDVDSAGAPPRPPAPQAAGPVESEPAPVQVVPAAATEQVGRNPFKVLYVEPKAAAAGGTTTSGVPTGTGTGTTSGTTAGTSAGTAAGGAGGTGGATGASRSGSAVAEQPKTPPKYLTVVTVDAAANQVGFKLVDRAAAKPEDVEQAVVVKPGEVFATYFKLLGYGTLLDANNVPRDCTDLQYGDARIKLCENESYQVG